MKKIIIKVLAFIIIYLSAFASFSQTNSFQNDMKQAFETFSNGKEFSDWLKGAEMMSSLGDNHEKEWLPYYWASYFYSQVARSFPKENPPKDTSAEDLLVLSQKNYYSSFNRLKNKTPQIRSDFHALQNLIYSFKSAFAKDEKNKITFKEKAERELKSAINTNPNNPLVNVLVATHLINKKDYRSVLAARQLLLQAKEDYAKRIEPRYMSTHWNEEWVNFWLSQTEKGIKALTNLTN